ncbi:hypothetical protein RJ640_027525 [Escallonia rubra]|uniref:Rapid alkalinization factor n=1 Tax=Escallonia rubra TaxID=112253 RepID=A0AA88RCK7_9ASTE|nr:hypothetical protein RJ640_027525 [Escallonia rubra]
MREAANSTTKVPKAHLQPMNILFLSLLFLHTHIKICDGFSFFDLNSPGTYELDLMAKRVCAGKIGECAAMAEAEEMDSESNRRALLMTRKYISYETLKRDIVPCGTPGASYYNCKPSGQANPYNRGCEVITRCARDIRDIKS